MGSVQYKKNMRSETCGDPGKSAGNWKKSYRNRSDGYEKSKIQNPWKYNNNDNDDAIRGTMRESENTPQ